MLKNTKAEDLIFKEERKLLSDFFSKTNANEASEALSEMLDAYILKGEGTPETTANNANISFMLSKLLFNLERLSQPEEVSKSPVEIIVNQKECSPN